MTLQPRRLVATVAATVLLTACTAGAASPSTSQSTAAPVAPTVTSPVASAATSPVASTATSTAPSQSEQTSPIPVTKVSLQLDFVVQTRWAPLLRGIDKGYFSSRGIDLDIVPGRGSDLALQVINAGNTDFAVVDLGNFLAQRAAVQTETTGIYAYLNIPTTGIASFEQLNDPKDMTGKSFGTVPQSSGRVNIPLVLHQNGVDWDEKKLLQLMDFSVLYPTLFEGKVDTAEVGIAGSWEGAYLSAKQQNRDLKLKLLVDWGFFDYGSLIIARNDAIANKKDLVSRLVAGIHESLNDSLANATPDEIFELMKKADPQSEKETVALIWENLKKYLKDPGPIDPKVIQYKLDRLKDEGTDVSKIVVDDVYTNEFIPTT
jgi:NitT/TauT family transport system substrate-binding protein